MTSASKFIYMDCVIFLKGFNRNVRLNIGTSLSFLKLARSSGFWKDIFLIFYKILL